MNSTNSSAVPAAPGAWLPATFTPMFQNSVLTAGTVTFIYLILTVFGQVQYVERKGGSPTMFYLLIWVLFCGWVSWGGLKYLKQSITLLMSQTLSHFVSIPTTALTTTESPQHSTDFALGPLIYFFDSKGWQNSQRAHL